MKRKTVKVKVLVTREYEVRLHDGATLEEVMPDLRARIKHGTTEFCGGGEYGFSIGEVVEVRCDE